MQTRKERPRDEIPNSDRRHDGEEARPDVEEDSEFKLRQNTNSAGTSVFYLNCYRGPCTGLVNAPASD